MDDTLTLLTVGAVARMVCCSEGTVRRADRVGVIQSRRDTSGRRIFGQDAVEKLRAHLHAQHTRHHAQRA